MESGNMRLGLAVDRLITTDDIKAMIGCEQSRTINKNLTDAGVPSIRLKGDTRWWFLGHVVEAIAANRNLFNGDEDEPENTGQGD